jgi:carbon storage regulator
MLVISRKAGEKIHIGDDIELTLVSVKGSCVRLAIDAPRDVVILRGELRERVREACTASHLQIK